MRANRRHYIFPVVAIDACLTGLAAPRLKIDWISTMVSRRRNCPWEEHLQIVLVIDPSGSIVKRVAEADRFRTLFDRQSTAFAETITSVVKETGCRVDYDPQSGPPSAWLQYCIVLPCLGFERII